MSQTDFTLDAYDYDLPESQIAQYPDDKPGRDRLMVVDRQGKAEPIHAWFEDLAKYLPAHALLVANNTRVVKCRLSGQRKSGGRSEFLLLTPLNLISGNEKSGSAEVAGLLRPAGKTAIGETLQLGENMAVRITEKGEFGQCRGLFTWQGNLAQLLETDGQLPLPPYIRRKPENLDNARYQTIYAKESGSAAAPTAGLHFTEETRASLAQAGFDWAELTLHVGYGTFSPVRCQDIHEHKMHAEYVEISEQTAARIAEAKAAGRPIVAVGTTSLRSLEGVYAQLGKIGPFAGLIDIFLYPGASFHVADCLLTNFHLPRSTLLMLASAFAGRSNMLSAYQEAVGQNYRFFSYGDAMLIR